MEGVNYIAVFQRGIDDLLRTVNNNSKFEVQCIVKTSSSLCSSKIQIGLPSRFTSSSLTVQSVKEEKIRLIVETEDSNNCRAKLKEVKAKEENALNIEVRMKNHVKKNET